MPDDSHGSSMKQAGANRVSICGPKVSEEPPIAVSHALEVLLLDPAAPFSAMTGSRPAPEHSEDRGIESCENTFGDDMTVVIGPSPYDRV